MPNRILGLSLMAVRESAVKAAIDHGMIGTEAEEYGDGVMFHAAETMIALLEKERDAVMDRGDVDLDKAVRAYEAKMKEVGND